MSETAVRAGLAAALLLAGAGGCRCAGSRTSDSGSATAAPTDSGGTAAATDSGGTAAPGDSGATAAPSDSGGTSAPTDSGGGTGATFPCGTAACASGVEYCEHFYPGAAGAMDTWTCYPLPPGCGAMPTCASCGFGGGGPGTGCMCMQSPAGDITVTCFGV